MHLVNNLYHLVAATTTTSKTTSTGSSSEFFLVIIVLFVLLYFLLIRPNQRRRMQAMRQARSYDLGDEVVAGGMVGRVVRIGDGEVDVEISDGVVVQFVPQAVQLRSAYMAGPGGRGAMGGRPGFGGPSTPGQATNGAGTTGQASMPGSRSRSVRRRPSGSDAWPDVSDSSFPDEAGENGPGGASSAGGAGEGGTAPSSGDR